MLNIDKNIFSENLALTQAYCELQIDRQEQNNASVLRSFNPIISGKPLFTFEEQTFSFELEPGKNSCTIAEWSIDPVRSSNQQLIEDLFEQQLNHKKERTLLNFVSSYKGDILISAIDECLTDGASEVSSLGLIDIYDMPPIDTWFYLHQSEQGRLLFGWIPQLLRHYANEAILVNCVDCIHWFDSLFPNERNSFLKIQ
jgi:hypothetical protein